ncbi:right-handed parallel beta-helix repeat-containing protein [Bacillus sp. FSL K6-0273]|uniref:right-handed parallel beta-helix repeat-containing protein n=1 Tax=Bacillus sp. FSL K6-0273 TaxID=2975328 RepID=UPI0030F81F2A
MEIEHIDYLDSLRVGTDKLNGAIDHSNKAIGKAIVAEVNSNNAIDAADNVQKQLNQLVINGDSSVEAAQARVEKDGTEHETLKAHTDAIHGKIGLLNDVFVNIEIFPIKIPEADDTARVQRALDHFETKSGTLFFPKMDYIINDELLVNYSCRIMMDRGGSFKVKDNSYLHSKGAKTSVFVLNGDNIIIEDIHINGNAKNNYTIGSDGKKYYLSFPSMPPGKYLGYSGIQVKGSNITVKNCFVEWCSWAGILVDSEIDSIISKNIKILNNCIENCPEDHISLHRCTEVDVIGNTIRDPMHHGVHAYYKCSYVNVMNNTITLTKANCFEFYPNAISLEAFGAVGIDHAVYTESEVSNIIVSNNKISGDLTSGVEIMGFAKNLLITDNQMSIIGNGILLDSPIIGVCKIADNQFINCNRGIFFNWDQTVNSKPSYIYEDFSSLIIESNQIKGSVLSHMAFYLNDRGTVPFTKMYIKIKGNNMKKGSSSLAYSIRFDSWPSYVEYNVEDNDFTDAHTGSAFSIPSGFVNADIYRFCKGNIGLVKNEKMTETSNPNGRQQVYSGNYGITVTLPSSLTQLDTNYSVIVTPEWKAGGIWITSKTTTTFGVNWDTPPSSNSNIGFMLVR